MRWKWKHRPARGAGAARSVSRYPRVDPTTVTRAGAGARGKAGPDFAAVNAAALACLSALCARWLPDGSRRGNEWIAKNPRREDQRPGSFSINLATGRWADFALPNEFFPHHASLSREHRDFIEKRLKGGNLPVTAICTSTLELGIDIGDVACVGQIGAPWSVAALRQRLGRSGRRAGQPAVLRMYAIEPETDGDSHPVDTLHLRLIRSVAMTELLVEGWCEPPRREALHLPTLTHQILSIIAERGGASARRLYATLCDRGPFRSVDPSLFARLLRQLGDLETALIEQAADGTLLPGREGERLVEHYSFFAVFHTPQEFRVVHDVKTLGTIPVSVPLVPDLTIFLSADAGV